MSGVVDLLMQALSEAVRDERNLGHVQSPGEAVTLVFPPGTTLKIGRRYNGTFDCYVVLPAGHPYPGRGWMRPDSGDRRYWNSWHGTTETEATRRAVIGALTALSEAEHVDGGERVAGG